MRTIPAGLVAHLAEGATTLCRAWILTRRDGAVLGFTDHDRDLTVAGIACRAGTGLEAAEATSELGFAVGGGEVAGALVSGAITEADIAAGRYDDASVATWLVDWSDPARAMLLERSTIGEIRRRDDAFVAELRSATHRLDETRGLTFGRTCSADLGDARCGVNLAALSATATVTTTDGRLTLTADGLYGIGDGFFDGGRLAWLGGANAGSAVEIKAHRAPGATAEIELWRRPGLPVAAGDLFRASAGCDKRLATCRDKFANTVNFRGFPHMPGNDFIVRVPVQGEPGLDGGSLFR